MIKGVFNYGKNTNTFIKNTFIKKPLWMIQSSKTVFNRKNIDYHIKKKYIYQNHNIRSFCVNKQNSNKVNEVLKKYTKIYLKGLIPAFIINLLLYKNNYNEYSLLLDKTKKKVHESSVVIKSIAWPFTFGYWIIIYIPIKIIEKTI